MKHTFLMGAVLFAAVVLTAQDSSSASTSAQVNPIDFKTFAGAKVNPPKVNDKSAYVFPTGGQLMIQISNCAEAKTDGAKLFVKTAGISTLRFFDTSSKQESLAGKTVQVSVTLSAKEPVKCKLFFEGQLDGKHFWRAKNVDVTNEEKTFDFTQTIPKGKLTGLYIRFDVPSVASLTIANAMMKEVPAGTSAK